MCFIGAADERKKGLSIKVPLKAFLSMFSQNSGNENRAQVPKENVASCINCFQFAVTWSLLVNGFLQVIPFPFKSGRKNFQKSDEDKLCSCMKPTISSCEVKQNERKVKEIIMVMRKARRKLEEVCHRRLLIIFSAFLYQIYTVHCFICRIG
ncbi:hypothetical protein Lalb_Chr21g0305961 [Lupinus albus]|uniref:Uncharacterized protein n=1 Tax=Lupinus albus TaxID=3870 RepID=A0A6A4NRC5_LUPAL|nr:hypothetical protein Lalb_Chr21g0305961 [Lupinus albus]